MSTEEEGAVKLLTHPRGPRLLIGETNPGPGMKTDDQIK